MLTLGNLRKPRRRQRQQERHQTKGIMSKTIAVHVLCVVNLSTFFAVLCKSRTVTQNDHALRGLRKSERPTAAVWYFHLESTAVITYLA